MQTHDDRGQLMKLNWPNLWALLDANGEPTETAVHGHVISAMINTTLRVHYHPTSGRPRELHVMAYDVMFGWQKIAEVGPVTPPEHEEDVLPNYLTFFAQWEDRPVGFLGWKNRIMADNGVLPGVRGPIDQLARMVLDLTRGYDGGIPDPNAVKVARELAQEVLDAHEIVDTKQPA